MAKIDSAYSYYLNTYGSSAVSRYDTHKKSELRNTYNRIVKLNKESPLYKISSSGDVKKFAIDIKENTRRIQNVASSLSEGEDGLWSNFQKKIAVSSDEDLVTAEYVGNGNDAENTDSFSIEVKQLACPQVNYGNYLKNNALDFAPGSYSFDLNTVSNSYEFQFNVNEDDTNRSVLAKLAKLINGAGVGLNAKLVMDDRDMSALKIESVQTGLEEGSKALFSIYPGTENASIQAMDTLGIDNTVSQAANSSFLLNGKEHSSLSNTFTVNNTFEVTLHGVGNENEPAVIGFKTNADAIADNVEKLVSSYNGIIETAHNYSSTQPESHKLYYDMSNVAYRFYNEFESMENHHREAGSIAWCCFYSDCVSTAGSLVGCCIRRRRPWWSAIDGRRSFVYRNFYWQYWHFLFCNVPADNGCNSAFLCDCCISRCGNMRVYGTCLLCKYAADAVIGIL